MRIHTNSGFHHMFGCVARREGGKREVNTEALKSVNLGEEGILVKNEKVHKEGAGDTDINFADFSVTVGLFCPQMANYRSCI